MIDQIDTALGLPNVVEVIWDFITTTQGNLVLLALGIGWLGILVWQPKFLQRFTGTNGPTVETLDARISAIDSTSKRVSEYEDRLREQGDRLARVEEKVDYVRQETQPTPPAFDAENEKPKIIVSYARMVWNVGGVDRTMTLAFDVHNASSVSVQPTGNTHGHLIFEAEVLMATSWQVLWHPAHELEPNGKGRLDVVVSISERLAESLAFKPKDGTFHVDLSDMRVEFSGRNRHGLELSLGYLSLGEKQVVACEDHIALQSIRSFVKWRAGLTDDERTR